MPDRAPLSDLSDRQLAALRGAAVWYAKYQANVIVDHAADDGAYAVAEREEYLDLIAALNHLGIRIRLPDPLVGAQSRAA